MRIYSGNCYLGTCGTPLGVVDVDGNGLFSGDIVVIWSDSGYYKSDFRVCLYHEYEQTSSGEINIVDMCGPWIYGLKSVPLLENVGEREGEYSGWNVLKMKSWEDVVDGEHWAALGINYRE